MDGKLLRFFLSVTMCWLVFGYPSLIPGNTMSGQYLLRQLYFLKSYLFSYHVQESIIILGGGVTLVIAHSFNDFNFSGSIAHLS